MARGSIFLFLGLALGGCSPSEPTVAQVGKIPISRVEYQKKLEQVAPEYQAYLMTPHGRRQFLDVLVREKLLLCAAMDSGTHSSEEFKDQIEKFKQEQAHRLKEFQEYLLTSLWLKGLRQGGVLAVTDPEIQAYYEKYPNEIEVRHILLSSEQESQRILRRIRSGEDFGTLARAVSLDTETASRGGRLPPFIYGEILPELEETSLKLRLGQISDVVQTRFGYHILRKAGEKKLALAQASERVRRLLEKQKLDRYLESIRSQFPVEVYDAEL